MRYNREAALMGIPDLPPNAFRKAFGKNAPRTLEGGGGVPIVSDVVGAVNDVVGGVVDAAVDVINDIPVVGKVADDVLGLDPNGGGIVPILKGVATALVLAPVTGGVGAALNTGLELGLGATGTAALGGATVGAATGGAKGAVYGAAGGALGSVISEYVNSNGTTTQIFDDGSHLTFDASGNPVAGVDIDGNAFNVVNGIGQYTDGTPLSGTPSPAAQAPQWQQQGYASEGDYADATLKGFDNPQTYSEATSVGIDNAGDFNALRSSGYSYADLQNLSNAGVSGQDIVYGAQNGYTPEEMKIFANDSIKVQQYADMGFTPDQIRAFSSTDTSLQDIQAMRNLGFTDQQIAASAQKGVLDPSAYQWYADRGYNPQAVYELTQQGTYDPQVFNDFYAAGPDASYGRVTQINDLSPQEMIRQAQLDPGSIESGRFTVGGQKIEGIGFGQDNVTVRLTDGQLVKYDYATGEATTKLPNGANWQKYDYVEPKVTVPTAEAPVPASQVKVTPVAPQTPITPTELPPATSLPSTTTQIFDDGSQLVINTQTGAPVSGIDSAGNAFTVNADTGIGSYNTTGTPLSQPPAPVAPVETAPAQTTPTTGTTTQTFDDGSQLVYDNTGKPIRGVDTNGDTFTINDQGVGTYDLTGKPLSEPPPPVVDAQPKPVSPGENAGSTVGKDGTLIPGVPDLVTGLVGGAIAPGIIGPLVTPTTPGYKSPYAGQTFTPTAPGERWSQDLVTPEMIPSYVGRAASVPFYNATSPVQSQYYWGVHPYVPLNQDLSLYNQIPEAPAVPWGLQQGFFEQPNAPVGQVTYGPDMTPTWSVK